MWYKYWRKTKSHQQNTQIIHSSSNSNHSNRVMSFVFLFSNLNRPRYSVVVCHLHLFAIGFVTKNIWNVEFESRLFLFTISAVLSFWEKLVVDETVRHSLCRQSKKKQLFFLYLLRWNSRHKSNSSATGHSGIRNLSHSAALIPGWFRILYLNISSIISNNIPISLLSRKYLN